MNDKVNGDKYEFNNSKIGAVGRNAKNISKIDLSENNSEQEHFTKDDKSQIKSKLSFKELLSNDKLEACLIDLKEYFKLNNNTEAFNQVIVQLSTLKGLDNKDIKNTLNDDEYLFQKNRIIEKTMKIIDNEII